MAKAKIIIVTAKKTFSPEDLDVFRRIRNVLEAHGLAAEIRVKEKTKLVVELKKVV